MALALSLLATPARAAVVVSVWAPSPTVVFDPFAPTYMPDPRVNWVWVAGGYDEYGYFVPGYWAPVEVRTGYAWAPGYWVGHSYYEGYWRPEARPGRAWIGGYYQNGRYVNARWVSESEAAHAHSHVSKRTAPPATRAPPPRPPPKHDERGHSGKSKKK